MSIIDRDKIKKRNYEEDFEADKAALRAIAQRAIDVELFTIPLYMTSMYSIKGMHQVNINNFDHYKGRIWPGSEPTCDAENENEKAFNSIFGVFIQEMFHLELTANLATAIGKRPKFTRGPLQRSDNGWKAYGEGNKIVPGIVDLRDTQNTSHLEVKLGPLDQNSIDLFRLIEQDDEKAKANIKSDKTHLYFPETPFADWEADDDEGDLPMFGSIGHMYECYAEYASIKYKGYTYERLYDDLGWTFERDDVEITQRPRLFEILYCENLKKKGYSGDMENCIPEDSPEYDKRKVMFNNYKGDEFPRIKTDFNCVPPSKAFKTAIKMMSAIVDQGEGHHDNQSFDSEGEVLKKYQPDEAVIATKYPSYNDDGVKLPDDEATHACARAQYETDTHYARFDEIRDKLDQIETWVDWHNAGHCWSENDLKNHDYVAPEDCNGAKDQDPRCAIPTPAEVANSMNRLKDKRGKSGDYFEAFSQGAVGAIYGVVRSLNQFWRDENYGLPLGAMRASGDRISIIWAVYGETPDLSLGIGRPSRTDNLFNACQGLNFENPGNSCAASEAYHTCKNANSCRTQGACGVVALDCEKVLPSPKKKCKKLDDTYYTAPGDNQCKTLAGCSVPISASQMLRVSSGEAEMTLYNFERDEDGDFTPVKLTNDAGEPATIPFKTGTTVYDAAWEAYTKVLEAKGEKAPKKPQPNDMRIALIPN